MDKRERLTFAGYVDKWWNKDGPLYPLHAMNALRVPLVRDACRLPDAPPNQPLRGTRILDVGCGGGILSEALARLGAEVTGLDPMSEAIEVAKSHASLSKPPLNIHYLAADLKSQLSELKGCMDAVVLSEVVEHIDNWRDVLSDASDCVKPGGHLIVTTINKTKFSYLMAIVAAEQLLRLIPRDTHEWDKFVTPDEVQSVLTSKNFDIRKLLGMFYNPITGHWSYTSNKAVNYVMLAQNCS